MLHECKRSSATRTHPGGGHNRLKTVSPIRRTGSSAMAREERTTGVWSLLGADVPSHVPDSSHRALADYGNVPHTTLYYRDDRRPLVEDKARGQQYLKPYKEDIVVKYLLQMSNLG